MQRWQVLPRARPQIVARGRQARLLDEPGFGPEIGPASANIFNSPSEVLDVNEPIVPEPTTAELSCLDQSRDVRAIDPELPARLLNRGMRATIDRDELHH